MESRSSKASRHGDEVPQLSCEACRDRKTRCDKMSPCSNCMSLGLICKPVHRLRLPRGRHVRDSSGVKGDLKRRIQRLEALVSHSAHGLRPGGKVSMMHHTPLPFKSNAITYRRVQSNEVQCSLTDGINGTEGTKGRAVLMQQPDDFWADLAEEVSIATKGFI
jgi:hypothetical protein